MVPHPAIEWKETVRNAVCEAMVDKGVQVFESSIEVDLVFVHKRPKSKTRKTKPNHRYWHASTPDADNLTKCVWDALNEYAFDDDCQIVKGSFTDVVAGDGDRAGLAIRIRETDSKLETWADGLIRTGEPQTAELFEG